MRCARIDAGVGVGIGGLRFVFFIELLLLGLSESLEGLEDAEELDLRRVVRYSHYRGRKVITGGRRRKRRRRRRKGL